MPTSRVHVNKYETKEDAGYLHPFACFSCRRSFKRSAARSVERTCPHCGSVAVVMNRKFKPPPRSDEAQWQKVELLSKHGFRFQRVYDEQGRSVRYPATLAEARQFVRRLPPPRPGAVRRARSNGAPPAKRARRR